MAPRRLHARWLGAVLLGCALLCARSARGESSDDPAQRPPLVTASGYLEAYYAYNFQRPINGLTNFRAFDNRHATLTLANAVLALNARAHRFAARVALQSGSTGETYYAAEPPRPGADGAAAGGPDVFKHLQEAYAVFDVATRVAVEAGLYLSPIGPESMAIKDTWLWSRSNLFYGLPFYHTGARLRAQPANGVTLRVGVLNGWNSVVDNNDTPSISAKATLELTPALSLDLHYLGGVERDAGAPEGPAWRHLFDNYMTWRPSDRVDLVLNADAGYERNRFGAAGWAAGAAFGRVALLPNRLFFAVRSDAVFEKRAIDGERISSPILFPTRWLSSHAAALDLRPVRFASVRLELRQDVAESAIFFSHSAPRAGTGVPAGFVPDERAQTTLTLGMTAWF